MVCWPARHADLAGRPDVFFDPAPGIEPSKSDTKLSKTKSRSLKIFIFHCSSSASRTSSSTSTSRGAGRPPAPSRANTCLGRRTYTSSITLTSGQPLKIEKTIIPASCGTQNSFFEKTQRPN